MLGKRHDRAERNIGLVNLGLTEETWAGGCRGLEMTVRWCVDGLRLVERPELVGDLPFDGWHGVSGQTSVCVRRQDGSHLVVIICGGHDHHGITLVGVFLFACVGSR